MWEMVTCDNSFNKDKPLVRATFETPEDWRAWLRTNRPDIINNPLEGFTIDRETVKQYGTNDRWSSLTRTEE